MNVFDKYARFYDLLYEEKDYEAEILFLKQLFDKYSRIPVQNILDLGCGTGGHAIRLAGRGYDVLGVDRSDAMLTEARAKSGAGAPGHVGPQFVQGDLRSFETDRKFDAVISMFAVMSYMTSNEDLLSAMRTARRHLKPGGIFFFDAWFGPAVLTERPADRYRIVNSGEEQLIRFVQSSMSVEHQTVDVAYKILQISNKVVLNEIEETHTMRYFFPQEVIFYLHSAGFEEVHLFPFLNPDRPLTEREWNFSAVALHSDD